MNNIRLDAAINEGEPSERLPMPYKIMSIEDAKERLQKHIAKIDELATKANDLKVESDGTNEEAVALGTTAKALFKKIEDKRKEIIEEPNQFVKSVNTFCKMFTDRLSSIETKMKEKVSQYRIVQEQRRREQEAAAKKAADDLQKKLDEDAKKTGTEPVVVEVPIIPKKDPVTRTETGASYARKAWSFEILNPAEVPREYLVVSDTLIRDAVKGGVRTIPGVKIFEQSKTSFRV